MDPNANLAEQLKLTARIYAELDRSHPSVDESDVARLCELVEALDEWLAGGGFLPKRWKR